jgi:hypothetical protein
MVEIPWVLQYPKMDCNNFRLHVVQSGPTEWKSNFRKSKFLGSYSPTYERFAKAQPINFPEVQTGKRPLGDHPANCRLWRR